jgi:AAA15 family ATPase/GTPase
MKQKNIFYGKPNSGKTSIAKSLSSYYKNIVYIDYFSFEYNDPFKFYAVDDNTDLIFVDDIKDLNKVLKHFFGKFLVVDKPFTETKVVLCPKVFLITESIEGVKIDKRKFNLIHIK